jgi:hypothetical protein
MAGGDRGRLSAVGHLHFSSPIQLRVRGSSQAIPGNMRLVGSRVDEIQ